MAAESAQLFMKAFWIIVIRMYLQCDAAEEIQNHTRK